MIPKDVDKSKLTDEELLDEFMMEFRAIRNGKPQLQRVEWLRVLDEIKKRGLLRK